MPDLRTLMTKAVESTSGDDGWSTMSGVGNYLVKSHPSFDPRTYKFAKLSTLAKAQDYLEVKSGSGSSLRIRLKPKAAAKKATAKKSATKKQ